MLPAESCADDVAIDLELMQHWTEDEARGDVHVHVHVVHVELQSDAPLIRLSEVCAAYFESGGAEMPVRARTKQPPPQPRPPTEASEASSVATEFYQMDMFGVKRGACRTKKPGGCACARFTPRIGLVKTEGLGGLSIAKCQACGHENLDHEHLGHWNEGEPQLVDETGRWKWIMSVEDGGAAKSKKVRMDD